MTSYTITPESSPSNSRLRICNIPGKAMTQGGKFHADDVFSGALLTILNPEIQIQRAFQVPEGYTGLVFDLGWGRFDHHQNGAPVRENGVPYAAFGLLWREFGEEFLLRHCSKEDTAREFARFDEQFVQPLDLDDNTGCGSDLASAIGVFNPSWDSSAEPDECYREALAFAKTLLTKHFETIFATVRASGSVRKAYSNMKDHVVILPFYCPWKQVLAGTDAWFVVYPSQRGGFGAQTVPARRGEGGSPYDFPAAWAGKSAAELMALTGLATIRFCHNNRFLTTTETQEDAIAACRLAIEAREAKPAPDME